MKHYSPILFLFSLLLVFLALTPFIYFIRDFSGGNIIEVSWRPLNLSRQGAEMFLSLTYRGTVPLTDVRLKIDAICSGKTCSSQEAHSNKIVEGNTIETRFLVPLNASSIRISLESKIAGLYFLRASTETGVPSHGLPG